MKAKHLFLSLSLLIAQFVAAQPSPTYYDGTAGLTGYSLKTKLSQIISNGHIDKGYNGLWTAYATTDRDLYFEKDNTVLDMYSENPAGADPYNFIYSTDQCGNYGSEGDCYNREHIVPQSLFSKQAPMVSDVHHIPPTDGKVNGMRSNYPFGVVATPTYTSQNGSKLGPNTTLGYGGTAFEPINEFKGDIARMIFYFVTRYESRIPEFSTDNGMLNGTTTQSISDWELKVLLTWHQNDPVSQREIDRNNAAFNHQGNRNPYIDHPEYVTQIWGTNTTVSDTQSPTAPTINSVTNITSSSATVNYSGATDNVAVSSYNVYLNNILYGNFGSQAANIYNLNPSTTYAVTVEALDATGNRSPMSSGYNFTTLAGAPATGNATELYISEYLEGTSNNKAIEISNATTEPIDLSVYSIKKQANGSGDWTNRIALSGILQPNTAFVVTHASYALTCSYVPNLKSNFLDFNGNDPVGLFKNDVLIDIVGNFNGGTANFAADTTLRRNVNNPSTSYSPAQWDVVALEDCSNLGVVNPVVTSLSTADPVTTELSIYPNPVRDQRIYVKGNSINKIEVAEIYSMDGKLIQRILRPFSSGNVLNLKNLPKGIYLLRLNQKTLKFIVN